MTPGAGGGARQRTWAGGTCLRRVGVGLGDSPLQHGAEVGGRAAPGQSSEQGELFPGAVVGQLDTCAKYGAPGGRVVPVFGHRSGVSKPLVFLVRSSGDTLVGHMDRPDDGKGG